MSRTEKVVLVTGVSGFIGQHCAAELLRRGYTVRGSLRSLAKGDIVRAAVAKAIEQTEALTFVEADLLDDAGWADAMDGCDAVLHVASPFIMGEPKDPNDLIRPAVEGTERVLRFAADARVSRVVLTSSTMAISSDMESGTAGPGDWADPDKVGSYAKSKILAERAAWKLAEAHDLDLVVINPGGVMGPTLSGQVRGTSTQMIADMILGKMSAIPDITVNMVDVRDVAQVHVAALAKDEAVGKRFVLASEEPVAMIHVARTLKEGGYDKVSTRRAPSFLLRMAAPFSRDLRGMVTFLGRRVQMDTRETREIFDWQPTPIETSLLDMAASLDL